MEQYKRAHLSSLLVRLPSSRRERTKEEEKKGKKALALEEAVNKQS